MATNLRKAKQELTKDVPPNGKWLSLTPTDEQLRNMDKAVLRWILDNGG